MQTPDKDRLNLWLDQALRQQGDVEPRAGLEGRVLASVSAQRCKRGRWLVWVAAVATACVGIVVWVGEMTHRPAGDYVTSSATPTAWKAGATRRPEVERPVDEAIHRRMRPAAGKDIEVAREPRLSQFPSPRRLSEQEQLLVQYVEESPDEAVLIAKEQAGRRKELELPTDDGPSKVDSDQ